MYVFENILHFEELPSQEMSLVHQNLHKVTLRKVVLGLLMEGN